MENNTVSISTTVHAPKNKTWQLFTDVNHTTQWNAANSDWHCTSAENDLQNDGRFKYKMAAKDGSMEFFFSGVYNKIETHQSIQYTLDDGRKVTTEFIEDGPDTTHINQIYEPENQNSLELQKIGWQQFCKLCRT